MALAMLLSIDEPYALDAIATIAATANGVASLTAAATVREWNAGHIRKHFA
jgi:hypothetical protein